MKRTLGKKTRVQDGTMMAFACDCITICQSSAYCICTGDNVEANIDVSNMGKIVATALSSSNYLWG